MKTMLLCNFHLYVVLESKIKSNVTGCMIAGKGNKTMRQTDKRTRETTQINYHVKFSLLFFPCMFAVHYCSKPKFHTP